MGSQNSNPSRSQTQLNSTNQENQINFLNSDLSIKSTGNNGRTEDYQTDKEPKVLAITAVNVSFKWLFGGNIVYLTGTFTNWTNHILMNKIINEFQHIIVLMFLSLLNIASIPKALSPGVYEYKFIVDGEWKFSPSDSIKKDAHDNINNIIDTTNYAKNNENDSLSNSQKSSFNNEKKVTPNVKLGAVIEKSGEGIEEDKLLFLTGGSDDPSSKNFDIMDFTLENKEKLFDNEAPPVPPHLLQIPFIMEKHKKINLYWGNNQNQRQEKQETEDKRIIETLGMFRRIENRKALSPSFHVAL